MPSWERDQPRPKPVGECSSTAVGELAFRCAASGYDDPAGGGFHGSEIRLVERDGQQAVTEEALARGHRRGVGRSRRRVLIRGTDVDASEADKALPGGVDAARAVGVVDLPHSRTDLLGVRQEQGQRRLVGDEAAYMLGVPGDQGEPADGATAAAEDVSGNVAGGFEHPPHVVGQHVRLGVLLAVVERATAEASRVVGDHHVVIGQHRCDGGEPRAVHGVTDQHQRGTRTLDLEVQPRTGNVEPMSRRGGNLDRRSSCVGGRQAIKAGSAGDCGPSARAGRPRREDS